MGGDRPPEERIEFLDALRGVAILGILPVNAAFFACPVGLAAEPGYPPGSGAPGAFSVHAIHALFESKFHTIFALLFGVGMAILRANVAGRGGRWAPVAGRRLGTLLLVGGAHAVLLWYGDILAFYAFFGLVLCWTPGRSSRGLLVAAAVLLAMLPVLLGLALAGIAGGVGWIRDFAAAGLVPDMPDGRHGGWAPGSWSGFGDGLAAMDPDFEIAVYRGGSFAEITMLRATTWAGAAVLEFPLWGPRIAGLFLLGMAWAGQGWFLRPGSAEGRRAFGRMLRWGLATGVPLTLGASVLSAWRPRTPAAAVGAELLQYLGSLGLAGVYVALVARACAAAPGAGWVRALAAVGRTALTNYLLQSVVMTFLFYRSTILLGAGLGWFGGVGRTGVLGIVAAVLAVQVGCSVLWLRAFRMGPFEWVWRAATYLRLAPLRR